MQTGMFTIIALAISTCLCAVAAVSFCKSNVFNDKRQNRIIVMMGLAAILWNIMSLGYSISTEPAFYNMFFYLLIAAFDMYVVALCLYIGRLVGMQGKVYNAFAGLGIALSVGDWLIFGLAPIHDFFSLGMRTAFYTRMSPVVYYHYLYITFYLVFCVLLVFQCFKKSKMRRQHVFVLKIVLVNCVMFILAMPDTLFPLFHIPSYPSSGIGVTIAFIGTIFWTTKENTFSISRENVTDAIYNEAKLAIIVLDVSGKIDSCNEYARTLLGISEAEKCDLRDLIEGDEIQLHRIMNGKKLSEHLQSRRTNISCSIRSVVSRDTYGDSYGVVVMITDATSEEKVLEQSLMLEKNEHMTYQLVQTLSKTIEAKDKYTKGHSARVAKYSVMIGEKFGYDSEKLKQLEYSAMLHDVGKIGISDTIINKTERLTDEEYEEIKKHPVIGAKILSDISEMPDIQDGARWHHERYGGAGYPDGLSGNDISEIARIIGVADAYDAMTSTRSYRDCLPQDVVRGEIKRGSGRQFDPQFADIMLHIIDEDKEYELKQAEGEK